MIIWKNWNEYLSFEIIERFVWLQNPGQMIDAVNVRLYLLLHSYAMFICRLKWNHDANALQKKNRAHGNNDMKCRNMKYRIWGKHRMHFWSCAFTVVIIHKWIRKHTKVYACKQTTLDIGQMNSLRKCDHCYMHDQVSILIANVKFKTKAHKCTYSHT